MLEQLAGTALSYGLGMAGAQNQNDYNKEAMGLQYSYNSMMQQKGQNNNKEMWDYTNYENQVKHMKAAGLNPALLYGMGGGGGSSTSGAQGSGTNAVGGNELQAGAAISGMALQNSMIQSQIKVNEAQAKKLDADANKTAGVDTELGKAETEYKKSLQALTEFQATSESENFNLMRAKVENVIASTNKLNAETKTETADAEVAQKTIDARCEEAIQKVNESLARQTAIKIGNSLTEKQIWEIGQKINQKSTELYQSARKIEQNDRALEIEGTRVYKELELRGQELDQRQQQIIQEWVFGGIKAAIDMKAASKKEPLPARKLEEGWVDKDQNQTRTFKRTWYE